MDVRTSSSTRGTRSAQGLVGLERPESDFRRGKRHVLYYDPRGNGGFITSELAAAGWEIDTAENTAQARSLIGHGDFDVGLFSFRATDPQSAGRDMEDLMSTDGQPQWIALLSRQDADRKETRRLVAEHCFDYHTLPADSQRLLVTLGHAYGMARIRDIPAARRLAGDRDSNEIVGTSPQVLNLTHDIRKVSRVDAPVLVCGESGTGKELAARSVHRNSARGAGPFVAVNCGALPSQLIQTELFGHEKGSFTGAHQRHTGRFEAAHGGTLFLDEVGDLPLELQVNLLRVLEEKSIQRVGGTRLIPVDVRMVAASHANLEQAVAAGRFREDLYFRLNVLQLTTPSLRDRGTDIELLAKYFYQRFADDEGAHAKGFTQEALRVMNYYTWPGNVRELMNRVQRATVMSEGPLIAASDLGLDRRVTERRMVTLDQARDSAEKRAITAALMQARNNISRAARDLGVSRTTLYRCLEKHGITA